MAVFRGSSLHLWSANGLTAGWHDGHQAPYRRLHDEAGHPGTRHALPEQFRIRYRTIGMGRGQPVAQLPTPSGAEVMCGEEDTLMASLNAVCLLGHLTRTPEVRYSAHGTPVAALGLAVNTRIKRRDDSWQDEPCFVDVVVFGTQASACATYLHKGDPVLLDGRLRYRTWEDQQGNKRSKHEVIAFRVQFLPKPGPRSDAEGRLAGASIGAEGDDEVPF